MKPGQHRRQYSPMWFNTVEPTPDQVMHAARCAKDQRMMQRQSGHNGGASQVFCGFLAETIVCDWYRQNRPSANSGNDHGVDIVISEKNIDVKCTQLNPRFGFDFYKTNSMLLSEQVHDRRKRTDVYLFSFYEKKGDRHFIHFVGWIRRDDISKTWLKTCKCRSDGVDRDFYFLPQQFLHDFSARAFPTEMSMWAKSWWV